MPLEISFLTLNWMSHFIGLVGVLLLCLPTFWLVKIIRRFDTHKNISPVDVSRAFIHENEQIREASAEEAAQIVEGFNAAVFIQKREHENPRNGHAGISLELKSGDKIYIVPRDGDVDITRYKGNRAVTYWARQPGLTKFLT